MRDAEWAELLDYAHQKLKLAEEAVKEMTERERLMVEVLKSDYQLVVRLATDRLASLDAAFPVERRPADSQTGQSWRRRLGAVPWMGDAIGADRMQLGYTDGDRLA